ncbi:hypothetical protein BDW74DRAFT_178841 [Aspergillus multicolor]|uniref:bZIP transcription factor n=1 Tax=Aspergillus multicolor TaxID=41759 RepID=UPI003CCD4D66
MTPRQLPQSKIPSEIVTTHEWYGVTDPKERRRLQNRANQRAHRTRKQNGPSQQAGTLQQRPRTKPNAAFVPLLARLERLEAALGSLAESHHRPAADSTESASTNTRSKTPPHRQVGAAGGYSAIEWASIPDARKRTILLAQVARFHSSYQLNNPCSDHLLSLTRVNVHRAFVANMDTLGITWEWMADDSISPFSIQISSPRPSTFSAQLSSLPCALRPTPLQLSSIYHTWINLFPCAIMRDNLIRAGNEWDDEELCTDIMGFWDGNAQGPHGLIVWGDPADPSAWEVSEGFVRKWGWVVKGCEELMRATDYWRGRRGVRPLFRRGLALGGGTKGLGGYDTAT